MPTTPLDRVLQGELAVRIFEESNDAFIVFNPQNGQIVEVNATAQRLTDCRRQQLLTRTITEVVFSSQDDGLSTLLAETSDTGFFQVRDGYHLLDADQNHVPVSITVSRLHIQPEPLALIIARDMTRRRQLQKEIREVERQLEQNRQLASLGELVATLAHEIRQPLYAISNFASVATTLLERGDLDKAIDTLRRISDESLRSSQVVTQIQSFVRSQQPDTSDVDINQLVHETLTYLAPETSHGAISIETKLMPASPVGLCNRLQLQEVLINLVRNGLDACSRAGISEPRIVIRTDQSPVYILISVSDNGPGIADDIRDRLFVPFTTSHPDGMGMGLAISRRMMTAICGRLDLQESNSAGTTFLISVPRAGQPPNDTSY